MLPMLLLISALLAASMSSLDSALNSLSAATMRDFVERGRTLEEHRILFLSKVTTVFWGLVITGCTKSAVSCAEMDPGSTFRAKWNRRTHS